ncbi:hypothetical protein TanjilG_18602 [Lupinus angustifolius]|uniref:ATP synthase mitochondrial F1 complex assembly factor 1 n=1 Tax=Lupinus angustifolius TaxID=3871 RepID=A0A394DBF4_LUPAN|nr:hypothetical protein TanjilG_18602 [Lupinus angustifolius]
MHRVLRSTLSRTLPSNSTISNHFNNPFQSSSSSSLIRSLFSAIPIGGTNSQKSQQRPEILCDFMKWGSVGFNRALSNFATGFTPLKPKPLDSIVDVHRLKNRDPQDIASAWDDVINFNLIALILVYCFSITLLYYSLFFARSGNKYHIGRGHIGATMKAKLYHLLEHRASECRYFVIPLWRGKGYTTMFIQVQAPHMMFTGLEDYKARGTQASPYFTVTFYKEFAESKDLVLIRGDIVFTSKLTDSEAEWLLETAQSFYLNDARGVGFLEFRYKKMEEWCGIIFNPDVQLHPAIICISTTTILEPDIVPPMYCKDEFLTWHKMHPSSADLHHMLDCS